MAAHPRYSLQAFLAAARTALAAPAGQRSRPLTFVIGNESADLDSLCSAVLLAYFRSHIPPHTLHVPLSNLRRDDLRLRPELQAALSTPSGPDTPSIDALLTLSELPDDLTATDSRWLLVDHNALTGDLARRFASSVVGCIDHHVDEGVVPAVAATGSALPRIIEPCGSCTSLIVRTHAADWRTLAAQQPLPASDRLLARLALAPILVDTSSLKNASKTTDADRAAATVAESFLTSEGDSAGAHITTNSTYDRTNYFAQLSRLKDDISSFSYHDVLRKDYKQWHEKTQAGSELILGMATVVQGLEYLLAHIGSRDELLQSVRAYAAEQHLDIVAIMTVRHEGGVFGRQLLLWAFTETGVTAAQAFVQANTERLELAPWNDGELDDTATTGTWRTCWTQGRTEFSRKQVAPLLREAMRSVGSI